MPGHAIPPSEIDRVLEDCNHLQTLIASHDIIFLLTDTRESRWMPTLLCATENKASASNICSCTTNKLMFDISHEQYDSSVNVMSLMKL